MPGGQEEGGLAAERDPQTSCFIGNKSREQSPGGGSGVRFLSLTHFCTIGIFFFFYNENTALYYLYK